MLVGAISPPRVLCRPLRVVAVGEDGEIAFDLDLADRGHGLAVRPGSSEAICFARRPGKFALVIDTLVGAVVTEIPAAPSRHFSGHGLFVQVATCCWRRRMTRCGTRA
jgi:hypothetical protein